MPLPHLRCIADLVHKARTPIAEGDENQKPSLSLYITLLTFDFAHPEYEMCATMMTAIKSLDDRVGGPRPNWVWEHWHPDWVFRRESEVWGEQIDQRYGANDVDPCRMPSTPIVGTVAESCCEGEGCPRDQ